MACETWLRRDYLIAHGIEPDEPACDHDPDVCPPLAPVVPPAPNPEGGGDQMSIAAVLNAAADHLDEMEDFRVDRDFKHGAGGAMFVLLYETAKALYGTTAIKHLERHLRGQLPHGQIQHWAETDRHVVTKALREAAALHPTHTQEPTP